MIKDRVSELESTVQSLELQLEDQEKQANDVISQWQESYAEVDERCTSLEAELTTAGSQNAPSIIDGDTVEDHVAGLESTVQSLQSQLEEQEREANDVVSQWRESYSIADERCTVLEAELATLQLQRPSATVGEGDIAEDRIVELESTVQSLHSQLEEQEKEANDVISQWQESHSSAEERCTALENELATVQSQVSSATVGDGDAAQDRAAELESTIQLLQSQLEEQEIESNGVILQWQNSHSEADEKCTDLERELAAVRSEMEALKSVQDKLAGDKSRIVILERK